jgi:hypothetical protein
MADYNGKMKMIAALNFQLMPNDFLTAVSCVIAGAKQFVNIL